MTHRNSWAAATVGSIVLCLCAIWLAGCVGKPAPVETPELETHEKARMAQSMLKAGRVGEAMSIMQEALAEDPDNARLHSYHGQLCFQAARYEEAEQAFLRALELDPYLTDAHNFLGAVYNELGRKSEAEEQYRIALADPAYPTPELVHLNLGLLYASEGRDREAIAEFRTAVEINPRFYKAHYELASILDRLGDLEEAAQEYLVAEPGYRRVGEYHYRLGWVYFRLNESVAARESLERAIAVAPGSNSAARANEVLRLMD